MKRTTLFFSLISQLLFTGAYAQDEKYFNECKFAESPSKLGYLVTSYDDAGLKAKKINDATLAAEHFHTVYWPKRAEAVLNSTIAFPEVGYQFGGAKMTCEKKIIEGKKFRLPAREEVEALKNCFFDDIDSKKYLGKEISQFVSKFPDIPYHKFWTSDSNGADSVFHFFIDEDGTLKSDYSNPQRFRHSLYCVYGADERSRNSLPTK